ncbi:MAG: ATP-binding cassette domain-containing protein [Bacteroidales bacterium]|nr:ATP-binding cassette domain-containing protein [Bacteroidales bacterium]
MDSLISFRNADILAGDNVVVHGLNMEVKAGDLVYILGKVGSGKTSIIRTITAENKIGEGEAEACGFNLKTLKQGDIPNLRRKLGVVFQDFRLLMDRSVWENLDFILKATGWKDRRKADARIDEVLEATGMSTKAHKMPHQLSGGEQQRIAIARALLNSPEVILADEPTGNLDEETTEEILQLLNKLNKENGTTLVMVTHDKSIVERYPGRVFICQDESCAEK